MCIVLKINHGQLLKKTIEKNNSPNHNTQVSKNENLDSLETDPPAEERCCPLPWPCVLWT